MKFNVNMFVGLAFCVVVLGFFGVFQRVLEIRETWRSDDVYTVARRSTYSVVSSSASWRASDGLATPTVSARSANSMFRHRPAFSYAPASVPAYRQSPIANRQGLYTTSSAEFRSFGGGGNAGGASMSGGAVSASSSSAVSGTAVSGVSMYSTSALAYNDNPRAGLPSGVGMQSFSGEIALASVSTYAGIGNTTAGGPMGVQGRRNAPGMGDNLDAWLQSIIENDGWSYSDGTYDYFDKNKLFQLYTEAIANGDLPTGVSWEQFLSWFNAQSDRYAFPIPSGVWFMCFLALGYGLYIAYRRKQKVVNS